MSSITINSNISALRAQRRLGTSSQLLLESYTRVSSGLRINRAKDDAAGLAIADSLRTDSRLVDAAKRNVNDGISMVNIISGALSQQKGIVIRLSELAEQSANGVMSSNQRIALNSEYQALLSEFDRIADSTTFNGLSLLRGDSGEVLRIMGGITGNADSLLSIARAQSHRFSGIIAQRSDVNGSGSVSFADNVALVSSMNPNTEPGSTSHLLQDYAELSFTDSQGRTGTLRFMISRANQDIGLSPPNVPLGPPSTMNVNATAIGADGEVYAGIPAGVISPTDSGFVVSFTFPTSGATASVGIDLRGAQFQSLDAGVPVSPTAIGFTHILNQHAARRALDSIRPPVRILSRNAELREFVISAKEALKDEPREKKSS